MNVADRYKLLEKIGAGSFATVYRAQDQELGREVAVKQIEAKFLTDSFQTERYWREATLLASFQHPHIVTIFDVVRDRGWLILELMQANLRDRLQGRAMEPKAVQTTLAQALRALSALHVRGVVHGDIKPSNLMIDHRKRIKVGDFGLARRVSHDEGSVISGTAKYMAPETLSPEFGEVGPASDLYSLGFAAYELLCGSRFEAMFPGLDAFGRDRQAAWMMWHAAADRTLPQLDRVLPGLPAGLVQTITRLTEKDPRRRVGSANEALALLGSISADSSSGEVPEQAGAGPTRAAKPSRALVIGVFVASMAVSAAMLFWPTSSADSPAPAQQPIVGIVRVFDPATQTLEYEDPGSGRPEELRLPDKPRIRLIGDSGADEFILPKRILPGDWIRAESGRNGWQLDVARPVASEGRITSVDVAARRLSVSIEQHRVRGPISLTVPTRARIELNGRPSDLSDLLAGDRTLVEHVLDPSGRAGQIAHQIHAFRESEIAGVVSSYDPARRTLTLAAGPGETEDLVFTLEPGAAFSVDGGGPATDGDVKPGLRVRIRVDSMVHAVTILPDQAVAEGRLLSVDAAQRRVRVQIDVSNVQEFSVAAQAVIRINQTPALLAELRADADRVQVFTRGNAADATAIDAVRSPRIDRYVLTIACGGGSAGPPRTRPHVQADAHAVYEAALQRYATSPDWARQLINPTHQEMLFEMQGGLPGLRPNTQAIIYLAGWGLLDRQQPAVLCGDDRKADPGETVLQLNEVMALLDRSESRRKLLLLDLVMIEEPADKPQETLDDLLAALRRPTGSTTVIVAAPPTAITDDEANDVSPFAAAIAAALRGEADADRDLDVTADELLQFLKQRFESQPPERRPFRWPAP